MKDRKIAIVYDWIDKWGGVERVLLSVHELFPTATFYTSYINYKTAPWAKNLKVKPSFIQQLPSFIRKNRMVSTPLYSYAFESFDFSSHDLVISISSAFAKGIITRPETRHLLYLLTPSRFLWVKAERYLANPLFKQSAKSYKKWDYAAAQRADRIVSISETVRQRCLKYYERSSQVIYPPFDTEYWSKIKFKINSKFKIINSKYFLVVSRLEPYKNVELVIETFNQSNEYLVIVGKGTLESPLKQKADRNIFFFSDLSDQELVLLYKKAEALIMPQEEDFGYVSLEAQFFGLPVIAWKKGGAQEIISEKKTGLFFERQDKKSLLSALARFKRISYNLKKSTKKYGVDNLKRFDKKVFTSKFLRIVREELNKTNSV